MQTRTRRARRLTAAFSAALIASTLATGTAADAIPVAPAALVGSTNGVVIDDAEFTVLLWPRNDIERELEDGDEVPTHVLPSSAVSTNGTEFSVHLSAADVPAEHINDDGTVHIDVIVRELDAQLIGTTSATVAMITGQQASDILWIDPVHPLAEGEERVPASLATLDLAPEPVRVTIDMEQQREAGSEGEMTAQTHCPSVVLKESSDRKVTIAGTYVPQYTSSTAWAGHSNSRKLTMGIAVSTSTGGTGWKASGTKTFESGVSFTWAKNQARTRSYRVETRYGRYRYQSINDRGYCIFSNEKWKPRYNTGGYTTYSTTSSPSWTGTCAPVSTGEWKRVRTDGYDYSLSTGVKIKSKIGIDLSLRRSYASSSYIGYKLTADMRLCGSNAVPSKASRVRLLYR